MQTKKKSGYNDEVETYNAEVDRFNAEVDRYNLKVACRKTQKQRKTKRRK